MPHDSSTEAPLDTSKGLLSQRVGDKYAHWLDIEVGQCIPWNKELGGCDSDDLLVIQCCRRMGRLVATDFPPIRFGHFVSGLDASRKKAAESDSAGRPAS